MGSAPQDPTPSWAKKLAFGFLLLVCILIGAGNLQAGIAFALTFLLVLAFWIGLAAVLRGIVGLYPASMSAESKHAVQGAVAGTLFLGSFALIGVALRGENRVLNFVKEHIPDGMSLGFIDPVFAAICIAGIWAHTLYRIQR